MIDTHTHLYFDDFKDLDEIISNAKSNNVNQMIAVGIDYQTSKNCLELSTKYPGVVFPTVGIHPTDIKSFDDVYLFEKLVMKNLDKIVAIGEVGLDYHHMSSPKDLQKKVFVYFVELAIKYNLPLIIHSRDAHDDLVDILINYKGKVRGVFHCFVGNVKEASEIVDLNFLLGIGGVSTFKQAKLLHESIIKSNIENIILETDCPFLTPVPYRGKKINEPVYVKFICDEVANLKNMTSSEVDEITTRNAKKLFGIE